MSLRNGENSEKLGKHSRVRKPTSRGKEYQLEQLKRKRKSAISSLNKSMFKLQMSLMKSDLHVIKLAKGNAETDADTLMRIHGCVTSTLEESEDVQGLVLEFSNVFDPYNKIMASANNLIRQLEREECDNISFEDSASGVSRFEVSRSHSTTFKSSQSSRSHRSIILKGSEAAAHRAALEMESAFAEQESALQQEIAMQDQQIAVQQSELDAEIRKFEAHQRRFEAELTEKRNRLLIESERRKRRIQQMQKLSLEKDRAKSEARELAPSQLGEIGSFVSRHLSLHDEPTWRPNFGNAAQGIQENAQSLPPLGAYNCHNSSPITVNKTAEPRPTGTWSMSNAPQETWPKSSWIPPATQVAAQQYQLPVSNVPQETSPKSNCVPPPTQVAMRQYETTDSCNVKPKVKLPAEDLNVFDGTKILDFPVWRSRFRDVIEKHVSDASRRISYLLNYTKGEAREAIEGFVIDASDESYKQAMSILDKWYGDELSIAREYKQKLKSWPPISIIDGGKSFRSFSNFLNSCKRLIPKKGYRPSLDDEELNQTLAVKLPKASREAWSRKVYIYKKEQKENKGVPSFPPFTKFTEHVEEEAFIASQPVVGTAVLEQIVTEQRKGNSQQGRFNNVKSSRTFATSSDRNDEEDSRVKLKQCLFCQKSHQLDLCDDFKKNSYESKAEFVKKHGLCFRCLKFGHISRNCRHPLSCSICSKKHPTVLHSNQRSTQKDEFVQNCNRVSTKPSTSKATSMMTSVTDKVKTTRIVPLYVYQNDNGKEKYKTYCALDEQSDTSFISEELCELLEVKAVKTTIKINCMGTDSVADCLKVKSLSVDSLDGNTLELPPCYSREEIPVNCDQIVTKQIARCDPNYKDILDEIPEFDKDIRVGLLLGTDCLKALKPIDVISDPKSDNYAIKSILGWSIVGMPSGKHGTERRTCNRVQACEMIPDNILPLCRTKEIISPSDVCQMMEIDFCEYQFRPNSNVHLRHSNQPTSIEDKRFVQICESNVKVTDTGHYELGLPFRDDDPTITNNKPLAIQRLKSVKKRMLRDLQFKEHYFEFVNKLITKGHAVRVDKSDKGLPGKTWYLIHHGVYHPLKPGKIRVVYDGSAKYRQVALNDLLLAGPCLTNNLIGVLMRFRKGKFCWTADLEQMFYSVYLSPKDQDFLRFLFWEDGDLDKDPVEFKLRVHGFGLSSSPGCSIFALMKTADDFESEFGESAAKVLRENSYVDDFLVSHDSLDVIQSLAKSTKEMCRKGGFKLTKYAANHHDVLTEIPADEYCSDLKDIEWCHSSFPNLRTLGVEWSIVHDSFMFRITLKDQPLTRRGILATVSSIWDPCGFVCPVILEGKLILQRLTRDNKDWDEEVPDDIRHRWEKWRRTLPELKGLKIERCFKPHDFGEIQKVELHHFSDSSSFAYGECSYLRLIDDRGRIHCSLVMAKARVAPLKSVSIPRLELTASLLAARISVILEEELQYEEATHTYWTDSKVVLGYISNESKRFHVYVANRVQEIREKSDHRRWFYIASKLNVADDVSRGISPSDLTDSCRFINGPEFLWNEIPIDGQLGANEFVELGASDPEVRKTVLSTQCWEQRIGFSEVLRFSSMEKLVKFVMVFRRFVQYLRLKSKMKESSNKIQFEKKFTVEDKQLAETILIKIAQRDAFSDEVTLFTKLHKDEDTTTALKKSSPLFRLHPFMDGNGILRVGGRLAESSLCEELKHPVILPKSHHVSKLVIRKYHEAVHHQGRGITHNAVREAGFWIIGGTSSVSTEVSRCVICRRLRGRVEKQQMANLPSERIEAAPAFSCCGCDVFGPFLIKDGRKEIKRYGILFTCLYSRGVRIEVAPSLETDSFLNALRRFICHNGPIRVLRCDRGSNFVGASRELRKAFEKIDHSKIGDFLMSENCDYFPFKFNVPSASYQGGVWERLIRSTRAVLNALLVKNGHQLDDDSLRTFMAEAEAIVNCRPLTVENLSSVDGPLPLTANHILTGKSRLVLPPPGHFERPDLYVRKRWRRVQHLSNEFWQRFRKEFLQMLQSRCKWNTVQRDLKINDIVIICDENLPRNAWKLGRIEKVFPCKDGLVRKVQCRVGNRLLDKHGKPTTQTLFLDRPIQKLVLLLRGDDAED